MSVLGLFPNGTLSEVLLTLPLQNRCNKFRPESVYG
jgi:hypothetical protein